MAKTDPFTVGTWNGQPNYTCVACPRADLNKNRLLLTMATECGNKDCPGKPKVAPPPATRRVAVPLLDAKGKRITSRALTDKERSTSVPPHEQQPSRTRRKES